MVPPRANSVRLSLPKRMAPAALSLATTVESPDGMFARRRADPDVVSTPAVSSWSLTAKGMPWSSPSQLPFCAAVSARAETAAQKGNWLGLLHGIPFAVKDQLDTAGVLTTSGSALLRANIPSGDSTVVARLKAAGAILLGKLNLTEFALGGTIRFPYGQPRNPWNPDHDPGGSSSGSGIAAAAALAAATLGEDTGGSIRSPASNCGAVGHRPTWGLVPRAGCIPLCHTMDAIGPITRTVEDAALLLAIIAGPDAGDPLMRRSAPEDVLTRLRDGVAGLRIGVVRELTSTADTDRETSVAVMEAAEALRKLGAKVDEVSLP